MSNQKMYWEQTKAIQVDGEFRSYLFLLLVTSFFSDLSFRKKNALLKLFKSFRENNFRCFFFFFGRGGGGGGVRCEFFFLKHPLVVNVSFRIIFIFKVYCSFETDLYLSLCLCLSFFISFPFLFV